MTLPFSHTCPRLRRRGMGGLANSRVISDRWKLAQADNSFESTVPNRHHGYQCKIRGVSCSHGNKKHYPNIRGSKLVIGTIRSGDRNFDIFYRNSHRPRLYCIIRYSGKFRPRKLIKIRQISHKKTWWVSWPIIFWLKDTQAIVHNSQLGHVQQMDHWGVEGISSIRAAVGCVILNTWKTVHL